MCAVQAGCAVLYYTKKRLFLDQSTQQLFDLLSKIYSLLIVRVGGAQCDLAVPLFFATNLYKNDMFSDQSTQQLFDFLPKIYSLLTVQVGGALCELAVPHFVATAFAAIIAAVANGSMTDHAVQLTARFSLSGCVALLNACPPLVAALLSLVCVSLGEAIFNAGRSACLGLVNQRLVAKLRGKLFQNLLAQVSALHCPFNTLYF